MISELIKMKTLFSATWNSSTQPRKQRKFRHNAPMHIRNKFMSVNLAKDLRKEFSRTNAKLAIGDVVKILRGDRSGEKGAVERIDLSKLKVYIKDIKRKKANGTEVFIPLHPSNLQIVDINLKDDGRAKRLKHKNQNQQQAKQPH